MSLGIGDETRAGGWRRSRSSSIIVPPFVRSLSGVAKHRQSLSLIDPSEGDRSKGLTGAAKLHFQTRGVVMVATARARGARERKLLYRGGWRAVAKTVPGRAIRIDDATLHSLHRSFVHSLARPLAPIRIRSGLLDGGDAMRRADAFVAILDAAPIPETLEPGLARAQARKID